MINIERDKRKLVNPVDDALLRDKFFSSKWAEYFQKYPCEFVEYYTGVKLSLWQKIYIKILYEVDKVFTRKGSDV